MLSERTGFAGGMCALAQLLAMAAQSLPRRRLPVSRTERADPSLRSG
jgi:hypothetical protein